VSRAVEAAVVEMAKSYEGSETIAGDARGTEDQAQTERPVPGDKFEKRIGQNGLDCGRDVRC
jgi:hypothetical protein